MPANHDHPSHLVAERVAGEEPFREALGGYVRRTPVLGPEVYAELLHRLGYVSQHVRLQVYLHVLPEPAAVVDWVKGTLLTDYRRRLPEKVYDEFLARYRSLLISELPEERPYPFAFKRILLWGKFARRGDDRNRTGVKGFAGPRVSHSATSPGRRRLATGGRHDRGYTGPALRM